MHTFKIFLGLIIFIIISNNTYSQSKDTTELKMGDKKILIIEEGEEIEEGISELRKGIIDFEVKKDKYEKKIIELEDSNKVYTEKLKKTDSETEKVDLSAKIEKNNQEISENKKKIEAFEKGIEQINLDIDDLQKKLDELSNELSEINPDEDNNFNFDDLTKNRRKRFKGHWAGFEFGLNNYLDKSMQMNLPDDGKFMELYINKSWGFGLNFMQYSIPLHSKYIGLVTGMGFEWNRYHFKQNINLIEDSLGVINAEYFEPNELKYSKNSLNMCYFKIPLIIEFQIPTGKKDKRIFCGVGVEGSVKLSSKVKKEYTINGDFRKDKIKGDYRLNPFRYGLTARLGYEFFELYANYSFATLFEKNYGPELYPISFGLRIDF